MNQLNAKLKKFCLQLHRNDNASPPITVAESTSIQTLTLMVTKIFEGKPTWENNNDMFLSLTTPTGKRAESHAKNKLTGYGDLLKILSVPHRDKQIVISQ